MAPRSPTRLTARALLVGDRIDLAGLERQDVLAANPLAFRSGEGFVVLFRYGAAVLVGLSLLEDQYAVEDARRLLKEYADLGLTKWLSYLVDGRIERG